MNPDQPGCLRQAGVRNSPADQNGLAALGFVFGGVTAGVVLVAAAVVLSHIQGYDIHPDPHKPSAVDATSFVRHAPHPAHPPAPIISLILPASASTANGLVISSMPGARKPSASAAFSA